VRLNGLPVIHLKTPLDGLPVFERNELLLAGGHAFRAHKLIGFAPALEQSLKFGYRHADVSQNATERSLGDIPTGMNWNGGATTVRMTHDAMAARYPRAASGDVHHQGQFVWHAEPAIRPMRASRRSMTAVVGLSPSPLALPGR
jgi:hypothetical protein